jgi:hypothetical protein
MDDLEKRLEARLRNAQQLELQVTARAEALSVHDWVMKVALALGRRPHDVWEGTATTHGGFLKPKVAEKTWKLYVDDARRYFSLSIKGDGRRTWLEVKDFWRTTKLEERDLGNEEKMERLMWRAFRNPLDSPPPPRPWDPLYW